MFAIYARRNPVRGLFFYLTVILLAVALPARANLPTDVAEPLTTLASKSLPIISALATELKKQFNTVTESSGAYTLENATVNGLTGTYVLFKPSGTTKFMFAALFKDLPLDSLGQSSFFDGVTPKTTLMVFSTPGIGSAAVSAWPSVLLDMDPVPATLYVEAGLNIFMPLKGLASESDATKLLKEAKLSLDSLRAEVRVSLKKALTATVVTTSAWEKPFGLKGTELKNMALQIGLTKSSNTTKRNIQAWGDFVLDNKTYFLWGSQSKYSVKSGTPPPPSRAFGLATKSISMEAVMEFVDAMPVVGDYKLGKTVNNNLPTDKITISNTSYSKPSAGALPDKKSYVLLYAEPGEKIANTGKKGPVFYANGSVELLGWKAASLKANIDPKKGKVIGSGTIDSPPTGSLPLNAGAKMKIDVDALKSKFSINLSGSAKIEDVTLAGASFDVSKTRIKGSVDYGCIPPMLKASIDTALSGRSLPRPSIGASDCAERTAEALADAARAVGHALTDAAKWVGDGIKGLVKSLKGETTTITNASIPLWSTAARHMMVTNMITDMTAKDVTSSKFTQTLTLPAGFGIGTTLSVPVTVTKTQLESDLTKINCKRDGRLSMLYKFKNSFIAGMTSDAIRAGGGDPDAETNFYEPFKTRAAEIKKIVEKVKSDGGIVWAPTKDAVNFRKYMDLEICEDTKAA